MLFSGLSIKENSCGEIKLLMNDHLTYSGEYVRLFGPIEKGRFHMHTAGLWVCLRGQQVSATNCCCHEVLISYSFEISCFCISCVCACVRAHTGGHANMGGTGPSSGQLSSPLARPPRATPHRDQRVRMMPARDRWIGEGGGEKPAQ